MADLHTIETVANAATSQVRAREFPALEEGNISFPGGRYLVDFERRSDTSASQASFAITHRVEGAPLIERLMEEDGRRKVQFACMVSSPNSSYRSTHVWNTAQQVVSWDEDDLGEPPLFTPMIVVSTPFRRRLETNRDGVHPLWHGRTVEFVTGMRLAIGSVVQLRSSVFQLLSFREDRELKGGEFRVDVETDGDFRFVIRLASDLHGFLRHAGSDPARDHILTHVVSACFAQLKSDWQEDADEEGWRSYRSLLALSEQLKSQGLPDWSDPAFSPELAATRLRPHKVAAGAIEEFEE